MKHRLLIIVLAVLCAIASASGQSIRTLGYNTTNGQVIYSGTNVLQFTNAGNIVASFKSISGTETLEIVSTDESLNTGYGSTAYGIGVGGDGLQIKYGSSNTSWGSPVLTDANGATLLMPSNKTNFRSAIGLPWIGLTNTNASGFRSALELSAGWLTNTNVTNFRTAIGLGLPALTSSNISNFKSATELQSFRSPDGYAALFWGDAEFLNVEDGINMSAPMAFIGPNAAAHASNSRANLGLPLQALTNTSNVTLVRALSGSTNTNHPFSGSISVTGTNNTNTLVFSNGILQSVQ